MTSASFCEAKPGRTLTVVGLGNIGSPFVPLIPSLPGIARVVLCDKDHYADSNLATQRMSRRDVGRWKSIVQAERLRALAPELEVVPVVGDVAHVPPGRLRSDLLVACVDSVGVRIQINEIAGRLCIPWMDGAVDPQEGLVRVNGYLPGPDNPCFECTLSDEDYRNLRGHQPCLASIEEAAPTNGPASLGSLTASLLAIECEKMLAGRIESALIGRQVVIAAEHHTHLLTVFRRNSRCRFDHASWQLVSVEGLVERLVLSEALRRLSAMAGAQVGLAVGGKTFGRALRCPGCGKVRPGLRLLGREPSGAGRCRRCQRTMLACGADLVRVLDASLPREVLALRLSDIGLMAGDVLEVSTPTGEVRHCEICGIAESRCERSFFGGPKTPAKQPDCDGRACEKEPFRKRSRKA